MKAYVFPGQGAQFVGMGKDLYDNSALAKEMFEKANEILGFSITDIMFEGTDEELKQTKVTQPAIFLHSAILAKVLGDDFKPEIRVHMTADDYPDDGLVSNAEMRQRGATSRGAPQKSFRVKLDKEVDLWRGERRLQLIKSFGILVGFAIS